MEKKVNLLLIILILTLAFFVRFWQIDRYPVGLNADEAAIGYNAYSLLQTGKDEHGNSWPVHFKSFGDYKPGFYFYLVLPFVQFLGLNLLAVRLPSLILGVFAIWGIILLASEIMPRSKGLKTFPLISGFLLAVSPWHLHFSRGGWEVNAATTFLVFGTFFFVRGLKFSRYFILSALFYVLAMYTYHSARVVAPLLIISFSVIYFREVFRYPKKVFISGVIGFILLIPLLLSFLSPAGASRFEGVGLFSQTGPVWRANESRGEHRDWNGLFVKLIHNKSVNYSLTFLQNYFDHFNGDFLFVDGDVIERSRTPETGQLYLFQAFFVLFGVYYFARLKPVTWQVIFLWLVIAPLAAAMTFQTPHALRAHNMVIPLTLISAYGLTGLLNWIRSQHKILVVLLSCCLFILGAWSIARYLHQYFVHYPKVYPSAWEYGFEELVKFVASTEGDYDKIFVTDRYDQPYVLFLFYLKYPPEKFQSEVVLTPRDQFGFSTVRDFDKYHFASINWNDFKNETNSLVIGTDQEIPDDANIIKNIYFPNDKIAFQVAKI